MVDGETSGGVIISADAPLGDTPVDGVLDDVVDFGVTALVTRDGPCSPWINGADVKARPGCSALPDEIADEAATVASELLYLLSGKQFTGAACGPVTVRPVRRDDTNGWWSRFSAGGYLSGSSFWNSYGQTFSGIALAYGHSAAPWVDLGAYPVTAIDQVVIDGVVIPANEYELLDYRRLARVLPTASSTPTEQFGWPTSQRLDLPLSAAGTFGVTFHFGLAPPAAGVLAAKALGAELARRSDPNRLPSVLPASTTSVTRQGVSAQVAPLFSKLKDGTTGIGEVDVFLGSYNPSGSRTKPQVWSPDMGRPQRQ